ALLDCALRLGAYHEVPPRRPWQCQDQRVRAGLHREGAQRLIARRQDIVRTGRRQGRNLEVAILADLGALQHVTVDGGDEEQAVDDRLLGDDAALRALFAAFERDDERLRG